MTDDIETRLRERLDALGNEEIDLTTQEGREMYAVRMSEIQAALALMQRVLLKQGLEEAAILHGLLTRARNRKRGYGRMSGGFHT